MSDLRARVEALAAAAAQTNDPVAPEEILAVLDDPNDALDPNVYSPVSVLVHAEGDTSSWRRQTWQELAEEREAEIRRLRKFATMVSDLDRNENGRHEGDADVGAPGGVSQGNFATGQLIGYGLGGSIRYVMPERGKRHDPDAWIVRS